MSSQNVVRSPESGKNYELLQTLGTGTFARVRLAIENPAKQFFAIKILKKYHILKLKQVDHVLNEKKILQKIKSPFVINFFETFQDRQNLFLVMEFVIGGEFFGYLRKKTRLDNGTAMFYAAQVTLFFEYLHGLGIVYRDLKPENILINVDGFIKITDFGFAKEVDGRTYTLCGTPEYIAPEVLLNKGHGKAVDWWTLGILLYEMLAGTPPFVDDDPMQVYQKILANKISFPKYFEKEAKNLIKGLLVADLSQRLGNLKDGAKDVKSHKYFLTVNFEKLQKKQVEPPYIPVVKSEGDTSLFESYPESEEGPLGHAPQLHLSSTKDDPFVDW